MNLLRRFLPVRAGDETRHLAVLGSSSSEIFDYVMGPCPLYHPFWASGWSARGLRGTKMQAYVRTIMTPLPRSTHVLLNFGAADVLFNARHKASQGHWNFEEMVSEAVQGIDSLARLLGRMGFRSVTATFIAPVAVLPDAYWYRSLPDSRQLPDRMLGMMYHQIFRRLQRRMPVLDSFDEMSCGPDGSFLLKPEFHRARPDHHPDYIRMIPLMESRLAALPGLPPFRSERHRQHYKHVRCPIRTLVPKMATRPRTCC